MIETIHDGVYGYRTKATIPKIAGAAGVPISGSLKIGKKWTFKSKEYSYINARCETGHLQARGEFGFDDGTLLSATFLKPCTVRGVTCGPSGADRTPCAPLASRVTNLSAVARD